MVFLPIATGIDDTELFTIYALTVMILCARHDAGTHAPPTVESFESS